MSVSVSLKYRDYYLRPLTVRDVTERYVRWLGDPDVTQFLEIRYQTHTHSSMCDYVQSFEQREDKFLFGIFTTRNDEHVGNGTVYDVNDNVGTFDYGFLVGEKDHWGRGAGLAASLMLLAFGFDSLRMRKFFGGCYRNHHKSRFVYKRIGCTLEGCLQGRFLLDGVPVDETIYSLSRDQWEGVKVKFGIE